MTEINKLTRVGDSIILPRKAEFIPFVGRIKRFKSDGEMYYYKSVDESSSPADLKVNGEILCELYLSRLAKNDFDLTTPIYFVAKDMEYYDNYSSIGVLNKDFMAGYGQVSHLQMVGGSKDFYNPTIKMIVDKGIAQKMTPGAFNDIKKLMFFDYLTAQTDRHGRNIALASEDTFWSPIYSTVIAYDYGNSFLAFRDLDNINEIAVYNHLNDAGMLKLGLDTPMSTYKQFINETISSDYISYFDRINAINSAASIIDKSRVSEIGEELENDIKLNRHKGFEHILEECIKIQADKLDNASATMKL